MGKAEAFYQKFMASRQESVRLELALQGYFLDGEMPDTQRRAFEDYLRRRIRPAAEALMQRDALPMLQALEAQGWMDAALVEDCLAAAIRLRKAEAFLWLLGVKAEKFGFSDRVFDL